MSTTQRTFIPFKYGILQTVFDLTEFFLRPFLWSVNGILGPWFQTEADRRSHQAAIWLEWLALIPLHMSAITALAFPTFLAFCFKSILHCFRAPYILSFKPVKLNSTADRWSIQAVEQSIVSIATANVCLLPGILSKFNNVCDPKDRAKTIGERLFIDQKYYRTMMHEQTNYKIKSNETKQLHVGKDSEALPSQSVNIIKRFPHTDFICFQETYDRDSTKLLVTELHKTFPWIVYDVGFWSPLINRCGMNSGLMVASRYEILAVDFKTFPVKKGVFKFLSPGLLMTKVLLNETNGCHGNRHKVGYIFNTHLQAFQGDDPIVEQQMSDILEWTLQFKKVTAEQGEEVIFDVLCGDFNIDNMSPGEVHLSHHKLFKVYRDVGRERPGKDCDWTIGTELRRPSLMDDILSTQDGLCSVLEDPYLRQQYVLDADLETASIESIYKPSVKTDSNGNPVLSPVGGKRRIDFVLYRNDLPVVVQNYNFISRFGNLTDHVPVSMTFKC